MILIASGMTWAEYKIRAQYFSSDVRLYKKVANSEDLTVEKTD